MGRPRLALESFEYRVSHRYREIAQKALGKPLPPGAVVHHLDGDELNNANTNLVICPNEAYHNQLHLRLEAFKACGNATWLKCYLCKKYDEPSKLFAVRKEGRNVTTFYHSACRSAYRRAQKEAKNA